MALISSFVRRISSSTLPIRSVVSPKPFNRAISAAGNVENHNSIGIQFIQYLRLSTFSDYDDLDAYSDVEERGIQNEFTYKKINESGERYLTLERKYGDEEIHIIVGEPFGSRDRPCLPMKVGILYGEDYDKAAEFEINLFPDRRYIKRLTLTRTSYMEKIQFLEKSLEHRGIKPSLLDVLKDCIRENGLKNDTDTDDRREKKTNPKVNLLPQVSGTSTYKNGWPTTIKKIFILPCTGNFQSDEISLLPCTGNISLLWSLFLKMNTRFREQNACPISRNYRHGPNTSRVIFLTFPTRVENAETLVESRFHAS